MYFLLSRTLGIVSGISAKLREVLRILPHQLHPILHVFRGILRRLTTSFNVLAHAFDRIAACDRDQHA